MVKKKMKRPAPENSDVSTRGLPTVVAKVTEVVVCVVSNQA